MSKFEDWLVEWNQLRNNNRSNDLETALLAINNWWQMLPINPHYLHWDDVERWPDPWELLADGVFCPLTKSLGIVYTLHLINRSDISKLEFAQTIDGDSLVLVNQGQYILNWAPDEVLNTQTLQTPIEKKMSASVVTQTLE